MIDITVDELKTLSVEELDNLLYEAEIEVEKALIARRAAYARYEAAVAQHNEACEYRKKVAAVLAQKVDEHASIRHSL